LGEFCQNIDLDWLILLKDKGLQGGGTGDVVVEIHERGVFRESGAKIVAG
jgi:hypothetical protein